MILLRCLSFIFFQLLHSSRVRKQPMQKPVSLSNLQISMQGDAMLMAIKKTLKVEARAKRVERGGATFARRALVRQKIVLIKPIARP